MPSEKPLPHLSTMHASTACSAALGHTYYLVFRCSARFALPCTKSLHKARAFITRQGPGTIPSPPYPQAKACAVPAAPAAPIC